MELISVLGLLAIGYFVGKSIESNHYKSIRKREKRLLSLPAVTLKSFSNSEDEIDKAELCTGSVVVSIDYYKRFVANLVNFFGGRIFTYESLLDRARREAVLRMKESARRSDIIINVRVETSTIAGRANSGKQSSVGSIEALAYGTAIYLKKNELQS